MEISKSLHIWATLNFYALYCGWFISFYEVFGISNLIFLSPAVLGCYREPHMCLCQEVVPPLESSEQEAVMPQNCLSATSSARCQVGLSQDLLFQVFVKKLWFFGFGVFNWSYPDLFELAWVIEIWFFYVEIACLFK